MNTNYTQAKVIPLKYFGYGAIVLITFITGTFYYLYQKEKGVKEILLQQGITTEASVQRLYYSKVSKKSSPNYFMDVSFFVDTSNSINTAQNTEKANSDSVKRVDVILNNLVLENKPLGNLQTASIPISKVIYDKYNVDDNIKIVFLKEDITKILLKEQLYYHNNSNK